MLKRSQKKFIGALAGAVLSFGGGFFLSGAEMAGTASFADISLAGAVSLPYAAAVFMGALIRCMLTETVGRCIVKLGALAVILAAKLFSERCSTPPGCGIVSTAAVLISGTAVSMLIGEFPQKLLFYAMYAAITGFTAYSAALLRDDLTHGGIIDLRGGSGFAYGVVFMVAEASLCAVSFPAVDLGIIAASFLTLSGAFFFGGTGGIICGALGVSGAFLASPELGTIAAVFPAAGLITGMLKTGRAFLSAIFFTMSCFMTAMLTGASAEVMPVFSILIGAGIFVTAAPYYSDRFICAGSPDDGMQDRVRRDFLSDAIDSVRKDHAGISAALSAKYKREEPSYSLAKTICGSCRMGGTCRGELAETAEELIPVIPENCVRKKEAAREIGIELKSRTADKITKMSFNSHRRLLDEQLKIAGDLLRMTGEEGSRYSAAVSSRIADRLTRCGIMPTEVIARYNTKNRLLTDIYFDLSDAPKDPERVRDLINDELGKKLTAAASVTSSKEVRMSFFEKPERSVEMYSASVCAEGSDVSGDSAAVFTDSTGVNYIVLSDGMGSGRTASLDSRMLISMFRKLICSGMETEAAVRMVNSLMVTRSPEETFATLDVLKIDCDEMTVTSVKSGAAATLMRLGSDVLRLSAPTFPIGIDERAEIYTATRSIAKGDMMIMFSDGISDNAALFIKELLLGGGSIKDIVRNIAVKADVFEPKLHSDDIMVIGIVVS